MSDGSCTTASLPRTLKKLLASEAPLERILPAFTSNVADLLRLHDRGRVKVGRSADFVVLDQHHDIRDVMIAGIWHVKEGRQQVYGQFEQQQTEERE